MTAVLNRAHFDRMTGADRVLQREILGLFQGQAAAWETALAAGRAWREAVHTLKGSARGIGFLALAAACETAEQCSDEASGLAAVRAALRDALGAIDDFGN